MGERQQKNTLTPSRKFMKSSVCRILGHDQFPHSKRKTYLAEKYQLLNEMFNAYQTSREIELGRWPDFPAPAYVE
jgi:hypothetical protein